MRKLRVKPTLIVVAILAAVVLSTAPASGQQFISYAAKFVCGVHSSPPTVSLPEGQYKTVVNIHNPHYLLDVTGAPAPVFFQKKVVLSVPQGQPPLPPSCKVDEALLADHSMQVTCPLIKSQLALSGLPSTGPLEGFLVLEVGVQGLAEPPVLPELDVVVVYASKAVGSTVETMDVERVPPTKVIGTPIQDPCDPD